MNWLETNEEHPYPSKEDLNNMTESTGLLRKQVHLWCTNVRRRNMCVRTQDDGTKILTKLPAGNKRSRKKVDKAQKETEENDLKVHVAPKPQYETPAEILTKPETEKDTTVALKLPSLIKLGLVNGFQPFRKNSDECCVLLGDHKEEASDSEDEWSTWWHS
ncbi:unnamed protein product [Moneuplotes crassus]|uniref:KN homeodomain domain-containing protein n=1 Tax=Euplotes crassus TaxID=5936 RepID=A0AAD1Y7W5_EUPCR|nr:unnamed protein product [Moneuplotes crassus]